MQLYIPYEKTKENTYILHEVFLSLDGLQKKYPNNEYIEESEPKEHKVTLPYKPTLDYIQNYELIKYPEGWRIIANTNDITKFDEISTDTIHYAKKHKWIQTKESFYKKFGKGQVTISLNAHFRAVIFSYGANSDHSYSSTRWRPDGKHQTILEAMQVIDSNNGHKS